MTLRNFKIYRWRKGGKWVYMDERWWRVNESDMIIEFGHGFHYTFKGIKKREDYTK